MGFIDKMRNKFMMGRGRAKQDAGRAMNDPYLEAEGQGERVDGATSPGRRAGQGRRPERARRVQLAATAWTRDRGGPRASKPGRQ